MIISFIILIPSVLLFDYFHILFDVYISKLQYNHTFYPLFLIILVIIYGFALLSILLYQNTAILFRKKVVLQKDEILEEKKRVEKFKPSFKVSSQPLLNTKCYVKT